MGNPVSVEATKNKRNEKDLFRGATRRVKMSTKQVYIPDDDVKMSLPLDRYCLSQSLGGEGAHPRHTSQLK